MPLRDVVVYPHMVVSLFVGRDKSIQALNEAMDSDKKILLIAQKKASDDDPSFDDIYEVGTLASMLQILKLPDGTIKVLVEGIERASVKSLTVTEHGFSALASMLESVGDDDDKEIEVLGRSLVNKFEQYIKLNSNIPPEAMVSLSGVDDMSRLADSIAVHMQIKIEEKQKILEILKIKERFERLLSLLESEVDLMYIEKRIRGRVKSQMEKSQREYYLNEQMKAIQKELGEIEGAPNEIDELAEKINSAGMPKETKEKADSEFNKLKMMPSMSAEATVVRNYIDWLVSVPWKGRSKVSRDLARAEKILNEDHYGLEKVKEHILEYLAVQNRVRKVKGPILCLVGPPGVGKTSLGRSIARATQRKFCRMSLGGIRDEAEIRGHRRTYIGSMPGKIIQSMARIHKRNPLFLFDEIDKMAMDFRGDPASALLEVLDPEQNHSFIDHYLEVEYDLSEVMFVTTANSTMNIPLPLLDRMELIELSGYTEDEKVNIAKDYLIPNQIKKNGLKGREISIDEGTICDIIRYYSREAGVRNLDREIARICRKVVKKIFDDPKTERMEVKPASLEQLIGVRRFRFGRAEAKDRVGQVTGLAWTEAGGDLLTIEVAIVSGKGKVMRTGQLGDVMKESTEAAMTVVRSRSTSLGIKEDFYKKHDFHIHVPDGAVPKDGPSAGGAMCVSLLSALTDTPVNSNVAMTGEITLRGEILPIGGLKEKLLAALRGGIDIVLIPKENERNLAEIPDNIKNNLDIRPVRWIDEVFEVALQNGLSMLSGGGRKRLLTSDEAVIERENDAIRRH